jgi:hypothetical protein
MPQQNKKAFLFENNTLTQNLYDSIKDQFIQATEVSEQHQQIYFAVLAVFVGGLIFIAPTKEPWTHTAMLVAIAFELIFGSVYFRSLVFFRSERLKLAARLDLFNLQWIVGCQLVGKATPYLILDSMWKKFHEPENTTRIVRILYLIKNFLGYNRNFLRNASREAIIAIVNCTSLGLGLWYTIICFPRFNYFNLNPILICLIPSLIYYFIHVFWSEYLVNVVISTFKELYQNKFKQMCGRDVNNLIYLGGNEEWPFKSY